MGNGESNQSWPAQIDGSGRLHLPAESRSALGWPRGMDVVIESDGDSLRVMSLALFTREVQDMFGTSEAGKSLMSEEILEDRRREARRERADG